MNAVFAADAVARLSGTVGVAAVTAGPGRSFRFVVSVNDPHSITWTKLAKFQSYKATYVFEDLWSLN